MVAGTARGPGATCESSSCVKTAWVKRATSRGLAAMLPPVHELRHEWFEISKKGTGGAGGAPASTGRGCEAYCFATTGYLRQVPRLRVQDGAP